MMRTHTQEDCVRLLGQKGYSIAAENEYEKLIGDLEDVHFWLHIKTDLEHQTLQIATDMVATGICLISMNANLEILNGAIENTLNGELTNFNRLESDMIESYKKLKFH
jgi:hypothetical protein